MSDHILISKPRASLPKRLSRNSSQSTSFVDPLHGCHSTSALLFYHLNFLVLNYAQSPNDAVMLGNTGARGRGDMFTTAEEKDMLLRQCKRTKRKDGLSVLQDKLYDGKLRELEMCEMLKS
ncbi:hypothetical protein Tco_0638260 [Tanacetum coccineum]